MIGQKFVSLFAIFFLIGITSCDLISQQIPNEPQAPEIEYPLTLDLLLEADWDLFGWGLLETPEGLVHDTRITAIFTGEGDGLRGTISGSAGCNNYFGSYEITGTNIRIKEIGLTKKFCGTPSGVMEQEAFFISALKAATGIRTLGGQLDILFGSQSQVLFFIGALPDEYR
jgi:hypothetical protein